MNNNKHRIYFLLLEAVFFSLVLLLSNKPLALTPFQFLVYGLAVFRTARTLSFNEIAEPLRSPFTEVKQDSCGAGANVCPRGSGFQYAIGSLLACPICTGTWAALMLYLVYVFLPNIYTTLSFVLGGAGLSECIHWTAEAVEWVGRAARVIAGMISPDEEEANDQVTSI